METQLEIEIVSLAEVPLETPIQHVWDAPTVLVVDDEPIICETVAAVLARSGLSVLKALNSKSALEIALRHSPDLLFSDIKMPGMNGIELAMAVATELPNCRVLLFSGHATQKELAEAQACGFDFPLLSKPIHPVDMLQRVFECLNWQPCSAESKRILSAQLPLPASMQTQFVS